jgi:hypothetical protein
MSNRIRVEGDSDIVVVPPGSANRSAAIAEAAEAFHEAVFDLDVLLHIVAERISCATGDYCSVALLSPDGRRFQALVAYHADPIPV